MAKDKNNNSNNNNANLIKNNYSLFPEHFNLVKSFPRNRKFSLSDRIVSTSFPASDENQNSLAASGEKSLTPKNVENSHKNVRRQPSCFPKAFEHSSNVSSPDYSITDLNINLFPSFLHRRQRGEKRPIPDEQKDEKYFERRKRNNEAAKKSRDARKIREDRIALRAALLEQENSILRAQVLTLRDELHSLQQLIDPTSSVML